MSSEQRINNMLNDLMRQRRILTNTLDERENQDAKWGANRNLPHDTWLRILVEEVGEVANALNEGDEENLRVELIQVMASAMAWVENYDRRREEEDIIKSLSKTINVTPAPRPRCFQSPPPDFLHCAELSPETDI